MGDPTAPRTPGRIVFEAYAQNRGWRDATGCKRIPPWRYLGPSIRDAWEVAAAAVPPPTAHPGIELRVRVAGDQGLLMLASSDQLHHIAKLSGYLAEIPDAGFHPGGWVETLPPVLASESRLFIEHRAVMLTMPTED